MTAPASAVPFFGVAREYAAHRDAILRRIDEALVTGSVLQGEPVKSFESRMAAFVGRQHGVATGSATDALHFALVAMGIGPGDEVLVTNFSFVASASAILRAGARPVFVDVDDSYNMDLDHAARRITPRTRAIVYVHIYGLMGDPARIEAFGQEHGLAVLEDAAQAHGAQRGGRAAGSLGRVSVISFDPTKVISAPGSGGIALTDDAALAARLRQLRYHGRGPSGLYEELGYNSQMPSLTAAVLSLKQDHHDAWLARRRAVAKAYTDGLRGLPFVPPPDAAGALHVYHKYVIRAERRDELRQFLQGRGVETMVHYPQPLSRQPLFKHLGDDDRDFPRVLALTGSVLSLPMHPFLSDAEVGRVVAEIRAFYGS